jgi:hypothetical protein
MKILWANADKTRLTILRDDGPILSITDRHPDWEFWAAQPVQDFESPPPEPPDPKLVGVEIEGVMCSATSADQAGLIAVLMAIQMQGAYFRPTRFEFENGNALVIHIGNYQTVTAIWLPFRQSFFIVSE